MKKIYIPSNLDLKKLLNEEFHDKNELDKFHYLLHLIYEQRILYKTTDEFVQLKSLYLRKIINQRFELYREKLINLGIIACDHRYIKGEKSYGYKILPPYSEVRHKEIRMTNINILKNIEKWKVRRLPETKIHIFLYKLLQKIDINYSKALAYVKTLPVNEYNSCKIAIDKFFNKDFFLYTDNYGRVHTNVTNLKSNIRNFLYFNGEKLVNVDVINSQPLLLLLTPPFLPSIRCARHCYFEDIDEDLVKYKNLVEKGILYDYIMEHTGENDRDRFKEKLFRETFFGKCVSKSFLVLFPSVAQRLLDIKKEDYRKLAWMMQRVESDLIINKVCRRIMDEHGEKVFISTIHDSILTTVEHVDKIKTVMLEEFGKVGLCPSVRVEAT